MTRVLLVNPPSLHRLASPLLGLQYVAAALLRAGCDVKVIDAAASRFDRDFEWILSEADAYAPQLVGFSLFTPSVREAYRLAERLTGRYPLLVAGGPHAGACPDEVLAHGFDVAVAGEGEEAVVRLAEAARGRGSLDDLPGIRYRAAGGSVRAGRPGFLPDLDALADPHSASHLFAPRWYTASDEWGAPGGILASRGCPGGCVFCAVSGGTFRSRSPASVTAELNDRHRRYGTSFFQFWDDAFTADGRRVFDLCDAIERDVEFPLAWSAATRVNMVRPELLRRLKAAGLAAITFGAESGDDDVLRAIGKGITTDAVVRALEWAKAVGLTTVCDFMFGFPQETPESLGRTLRFMERIAPLVDCFSPKGVVIPLPGTPLYHRFHERYGFTDWWLTGAPSPFASPSPPPPEDAAAFTRSYCEDPALDLDFFRYSGEVRESILACLKFKGAHNLKSMGVGGRP